MDIQPRSFQSFLSEQLKLLETELVAQHSRILESCLSTAAADQHGELRVIEGSSSCWLPPPPPQVPVLCLEVPSVPVQPPHSVEDPDERDQAFVLACPPHSPPALRVEETTRTAIGHLVNGYGSAAPSVREVSSQYNMELHMSKMSAELTSLRSTVLAALGDSSFRPMNSVQSVQSGWAEDSDTDRRTLRPSATWGSRRPSHNAITPVAMKSAYEDEPPLLSVPRKSGQRSSSKEKGPHSPSSVVAGDIQKVPSEVQETSTPQLERSRSHFSLREAWSKKSAEKLQRAGKSARASTLGFLRSVGSCEDLASIGQGGTVPDSSQEWICIIHPGSPFRTSWTFLSMALLGYDAVMTPMVVFDLRDTLLLKVLALIISAFWLVDIPLNFMTAYIRENGSTETSRREIARRYFQTWLLFDLTVVTVDWTQLILDTTGGNTSNSLGLVRALRVMRLARLGRLLKAPAVLESILEKFASGVTGMRSERLVLILPMVKSVLLIVLLLHFMACAWFAIGSSSSHGWVDTQEEFLSGMHKPETQYATSLHWALTQFAGSMDVYPRTLQERWFATCALFMGFMISICFAAIITSSMTQVFIIQEHKASQFMRLRRFLVEAGVSQQLRERIRQNIRYHFTRKELHTAEEDVELLAFATPLLRAELHRELYQPTLRVHPLFERLAETVFTARKLCDTAVSKMHVSREDIVFSPGEVQEQPCMLVVMAGMFNYITGGPMPRQSSSIEDLNGDLPLLNRGASSSKRPSQLSVTEVTWGMWLCEMHLWIQDWVFHGQLRAQTHSEMLLVDANGFCTATMHMPELLDYAAHFATLINGMPLPSDLGHKAESWEVVHSTYGLTVPLSDGHSTEEFLSTASHRVAVFASVKEAFRRWFSP